MPDEFCTALGMIAISFSELDDRLSEAIASLLGSDNGVGSIVVAELSFRAKINLFASLVRYHAAGRGSLAIPTAPVVDVMQELCNNILSAAELRNTIMHSSWIGLDTRDGKIVRKKMAAKQKHGLRVTEEEHDSGYLLDITEFIESVACDLVGFMEELHKEELPR